MSLKTLRTIGGFVNNFTKGAAGKKIVSAYANGKKFDEKHVRKHFKARGIKPSDIDRFISEAKSIGKAFTDWKKVLNGKIDGEELVERIQEANNHLTALEQDVLIGPKEERNTPTKIEIKVNFSETPAETKDSSKLTMSYGLKLVVWLDKLCSLANRRLEEAKLS